MGIDGGVFRQWRTNNRSHRGSVKKKDKQRFFVGKNYIEGKTVQEETDETLVSEELVTRASKLVSLSPCTFISPYAPLCPAMSLDAKS